jgi:glycerophosphoryl diester phosphodiesterase
MKNDFLRLRSILIFFLLALFIISSCVERKVEFVAHRGASYDAPENTLAAFHLAWKQGADAIEGDFFLSKDSAIVCIHDKTTKKFAVEDLVVAESTLEQLKELDVGLWKDVKWRGEKIPTIEEVFATVPVGKKIFIEIKCGQEIVPVLKKSLAQSVLGPEQTIVISFNKEVIRQVRMTIPEIKAYWLTGFRKNDDTGFWTPSLATIHEVLSDIKATGLDCSARDEVLTPSFVESIKSAGYELHVWTVDDPDRAKRLRDLGVLSITTNRPGWLREQLR